jgi:4'-phosphopantetheinyl transferase
MTTRRAGQMAPDSNVLTVWVIEVGTLTADVAALWRSVLGPEEIDRAANFLLDADRQTYIAAHALTRGLLSAISGRPVHSFRFGTDGRGRSGIVSPEGLEGLQFSLTHTDGLAACAAAIGFACGLDSESRDRKKMQPEIAETILAPSEIDLLRAAPTEFRHETFLRLWTLREAYTKATGQGVSFPRETFSFALDPVGIRFPADNVGAATGWHLFNWSTERHILSLAVCRDKDRPLTVTRRTLAQDELSSLVA